MRYIDEKTLVFAKCPPLTMYFQDLLQTRPAVCISTVSPDILSSTQTRA